jgi:hypothetical protein
LPAGRGTSIERMDRAHIPNRLDRAFRRAFFMRRMRGRRTDPIALRELWQFRPATRWTEARVLDGIPFAVIGGVATRLYMPERTTADIDILVQAADFDAAVAQLVAKGYRQHTHPLEFADTRLGLIGRRVQSELPVDVLSSTQSWVDDAVASVRPDDRGLPIVGLPYLVALKLDASRGVDQGDLTRMLGFADEDALAGVRAVVGELLPSDLDDLEQYIEIGRFEVGS